MLTNSGKERGIPIERSSMAQARSIGSVTTFGSSVRSGVKHTIQKGII